METYYGESEDTARPIIAGARKASVREARLDIENNFWRDEAPLTELPRIWHSSETFAPLRQLIHERRSAQSYSGSNAPANGMPANVFFDILRRTVNNPAWFPWKQSVQPFFFVHRVDGLEPGVYILCRCDNIDDENSCSTSDLRHRLDPNSVHLWQEVPNAPQDLRYRFLLLKAGDVKDAARLSSCTQVYPRP